MSKIIINSEPHKHFYSAKDINYRRIIGYFLGLISFLAIAAMPLLALMNSLIYLFHNIFKIFWFQTSVRISKNAAILDKSLYQKTSAELPVYSILIALYKEANKVPNIIEAMLQLNYPVNKLEIKFLLEEDDALTQRAFALENLPSHMQILIVPDSFPKTKPKALNYGLQFCTGKYVAIYDAEDEPEPDQLLKAVYEFEQLDEKCICLQARLNFYNRDNFILPKLCSIEYCFWFDYLLRALSYYNFPIPLGGTSNHLKRKELCEIGQWDAYNVTEDAELGLRIYLAGYSSKISDSITLEEAPDNIVPWLLQRSRWIKGFMQTVLVFYLNSARADKNLLKTNIVAYFFVGFSSYNFLILPWLFFLYAYCSNGNDALHYLSIINFIISICFSYTSCYVILAISPLYKTHKRYIIFDMMAFILWPLYFLLHSIASYKSLIELATAPFYWQKTPHGVNHLTEPISRKM